MIISADMYKLCIVSHAYILFAGADMINDVSAGKFDPSMLSTVGSYGVPYISMHMRGEPTTMMESIYTTYKDDSTSMVLEVANELNKQLQDNVNQHIPLWLQIIDPGIGFAKNYKQNIQLLKPCNIHLFKKLLNDRPLLVGISRKKFLTKIIMDTYHQRILDTVAMNNMNTDHDDDDEYNSKPSCNKSIVGMSIKVDTSNSCRDIATSAGCIAAMMGGANIVRVHNVEHTRIALDTIHTLY